MTANPNTPSRAHAPSSPKRRLPGFWKLISDGCDLASISNDQKGAAAEGGCNSDASPTAQNLVIHDESGDLAHPQATSREVADPGSDAFEMKVFQSPRRAQASTRSADLLFVALIRDHDHAWLAFPITKISHNKISHKSTNSTESSLHTATHFSALIPREAWRTLLPSVAFLPAESPVWNLHSKELADLEETFAQSKIIVSEGILWHVTPSTTWTTAALPFLESQKPPKLLLQDWERQLREIASRISDGKNPKDTSASSTSVPTQKPQSQVDSPPESLPDSPCHYLLSFHGLIFPIRALHEQLLQALAIQSAEPQIDWLLDWGEQPVEIDWPAIPFATESLPTKEPSKTTSKASSIAQAQKLPIRQQQPKPTKKKKHNRQKLIVAMFAGTAATIALLFCSSFFTTSPKTTPRKTSAEPATSNDPHASKNHGEPASNPNSQPESSELADIANMPEIADMAEITATPALESSDALIPLSPDQIVLQSLANSGTPNRPASVNQGLTQPAAELMDRDRLALGREAMGREAMGREAMGREAMGGELVGDVEPTNAPGAEAPDLIAPEGVAGVDPGIVDGDLVLEQPPGDSLFTIPATKAFQRVELKTNPQSAMNVTDSFSKNRPCWAQLKLTDEAISEIAVQPAEFEIALSDAPAKWRLTLDDVVPELHVYLLTKPGRRWYFMVQVGVHFPGDIHPTPLGRDDAANVVLKLQAHQQWLSQSIEALRNSPFPKRVPGRPDVFTQIRELQSQQKETNKAIERWTEVARLCHELFSYGSVAITLDEPPPESSNEDAPKP